MTPATIFIYCTIQFGPNGPAVCLPVQCRARKPPWIATSSVMGLLFFHSRAGQPYCSQGGESGPFIHDFCSDQQRVPLFALGVAT